MEAIHMLNRYFVGQKDLKPEIAVMMEHMKSGANLNLMIRGPSGYGKTHLAKIISSYIANDKYVLYLGNVNIGFFIGEKRVHIFDEIHRLKNVEGLYPIMDSEKFCIFILTNEYDDLKEPLVNRCVIINIQEYNLGDMKEIIQRFFNQKKMPVPDYFSGTIALYARGSPREAKILAKRLEIIFIEKGIPIGLIELEEMLDMLRIYKGGFTELDLKYLDVLKKQKTASLNTLSRALNVPKYTLLNEIEPFLIKKDLINITSKGRILNV